MKRKQRKKKSNAAAENEEKPKRTVPYSSSSSTSLGVKRTEPQFKSSSSFLDKMRAKLSGGHFRMLNEKLYTCTGKEALQYFREDPELFNVYKRIPHLMLCGHSMFVVFHEGDMLYYWTVGTRIKATELRPQIFVLLALAYLHDTCAFDYMEIIANMFLSHILMPNVQYHTGYQEQMSHWPEQPVNIIIKWLKDRSSSLIVADFGCGDARLAKNVKNKVFSFDLVANDPSVIACDMSKTFLDSSSIDVSVFCLSLMGIDYPSYLQEAHRVLKPCGWLLVAEVKSRYDPNNGGADPDAFIKAVNELGFTLSTKDFSNKMFILLYFKKKEKQNSTKKHIEWPELKPCLYKRR